MHLAGLEWLILNHGNAWRPGMHLTLWLHIVLVANQ